MDMDKRNKLIATIMQQYDNGVSPAVVGIDEFFDGNSDEHSLAPNYVGDQHPLIGHMWKVLRDIRNRCNVDHVLVGIHECPEADDETDFDIWPAAENVYIYTSAPEAEVVEWVRELGCEEKLFHGWPYGVSAAAPVIRSGYKVYALCWD